MNSAIAGPAYGNMSTYMGICTIKSSREIAVYIRDLDIWVTSRPWSNDVLLRASKDILPPPPHTHTHTQSYHSAGISAPCSLY